MTTAAGDPLPNWLNFSADTKAFTTTAIPEGALPMQVVVIVNGTRTTIVISERNE